MIRFFFLIAALVAFSTSAKAHTIEFTDNDVQAFRQVCDFARGSPAVNLETAGAITQFCLTFIGRLGAAAVQRPKEAEPKKE